MNRAKKLNFLGKIFDLKKFNILINRLKKLFCPEQSHLKGVLKEFTHFNYLKCNCFQKINKKKLEIGDYNKGYSFFLIKAKVFSNRCHQNNMSFIFFCVILFFRSSKSNVSVYIYMFIFFKKRKDSRV